MTLLESRAFIVLVAAALSASACGADTTRWGGPGGGDLDRCALLGDDEVANAIGPHHGGRAGGPDAHALYGNASCRWIARDAPHVFVELAVFGARSEAWARDQITGDPLPGAPMDMRYDETSAELWFDCKPGLCSLQVYTPSGIEPRIALALARYVEQRL